MHDYARSVQHNKKRQHKKHPKAALPIWLLPLTLILVAALAFGLYKLTSVAPAAVPTTTKSVPEKPKKQPQKTASKQPAKTAQEQYDFYTMLPESEVIAPRVEAYVSKKPDAAAQKYAYLLQAGSFRSPAEADKLRAKLLLEGLSATTSKITNANGSVWHRVMVGPFTSRSKLNHAQDILADANTESMVVKVKQ